MSTLQTPFIKLSAQDSLESKIYALIDDFKEFIPNDSDRYRLSYSLYKTKIGEGDSVLISLKKNKLVLNNISIEQLAKKIEEKFASL